MSRNRGPHPQCIGKCIEFQAKKPMSERRYEFRQKRCQMCDQWVQYNRVRYHVEIIN